MERTFSGCVKHIYLIKEMISYIGKNKNLPTWLFCYLLNISGVLSNGVDGLIESWLFRKREAADKRIAGSVSHPTVEAGNSSLNNPTCKELGVWISLNRD